MTVFESGRDLLVVDCGVMFPGSDLPGVDLVLPDYGYVVERRKSLRGIVITHAHLDHIGGLPYLLRALDRPVPIYGSRLTLVSSERSEEAGLPVPPLHELPADGHARPVHRARLPRHPLDPRRARLVETPAGRIVHTGDYKLDPTPSAARRRISRLKRLTRQGVLAMLGDSTNADRPAARRPSRSSPARRDHHRRGRRPRRDCDLRLAARPDPADPAAGRSGRPQGRPGRPQHGQERRGCARADYPMCRAAR
jgi:ribonuclease J